MKIGLPVVFVKHFFQNWITLFNENKDSRKSSPSLCFVPPVDIFHCSTRQELHPLHVPRGAKPFNVPATPTLSGEAAGAAFVNSKDPPLLQQGNPWLR